MKNPTLRTSFCNHNFVSRVNRRHFLRATGATLALPFLESLARAAAPVPPRRMLAIMTNMGVMPRYFFPEKVGSDYGSTPYLDLIKAHRDYFTVLAHAASRSRAAARSTRSIISVTVWM